MEVEDDEILTLGEEYKNVVILRYCDRVNPQSFKGPSLIQRRINSLTTKIKNLLGKM